MSETRPEEAGQESPATLGGVKEVAIEHVAGVLLRGPLGERHRLTPVAVPGGGAQGWRVRFSETNRRGAYEVDGNTLFVSQGLGCVGFAIRGNLEQLAQVVGQPLAALTLSVDPSGSVAVPPPSKNPERASLAPDRMSFQRGASAMEPPSLPNQPAAAYAPRSPWMGRANRACTVVMP